MSTRHHFSWALKDDKDEERWIFNMMAVSSKQLEPGTESAVSTFQVNTWNSQKSWNSQKFARGRTKRSGGCLLEGAQTKREVRWLSAIKVPEQNELPV